MAESTAKPDETRERVRSILEEELARVRSPEHADAVLRRHGLEPWEPLPAPEPEWLAGKLSGWLQRQRQAMLERKRRRVAGGGRAGEG